MKKIIVLLALLAIAPAHAEEMRPAVGKPLQAAGAALRAGRYAQALAFVRQADAVPGKTGHESAVIDQMRAAIAERSGDTATAAAAYQRMLANGSAGPGEAIRIYQALASMTYKRGEYGASVNWVQKYFKAGGTSAEMHTLLIQGLYLSRNYAEAGRLQAQVVAAETRAGRIPPEEQLKLLYACQQGAHDNAGSLATMKQLVLYYQKPDYWRNVINTLLAKPGLADRLRFEIYRLEFSLGLVNTPDDAMEMAQLAVQAKLPGDAKDTVDKSFAGGLLGVGPQASRHLRLKALVEKNYAETLKGVAKDEADAQSDRDGNSLLAVGETYVSFNQTQKGIALIQQAIQKDDLHHVDDAKLQLGLAYLKAGDKKRAIATLRTVGGTDGTADIAQLWLLHIGK
jgi:tetratricopeptide (TPR) repeat protein